MMTNMQFVFLGNCNLKLSLYYGLF